MQNSVDEKLKTGGIQRSSTETQFDEKEDEML